MSTTFRSGRIVRFLLVLVMLSVVVACTTAPAEPEASATATVGATEAPEEAAPEPTAEEAAPEPTAEEAAPEPTAEEATTGEPVNVTVGILWPLSGSLAALGEDGQRGVELALEVINTTQYAEVLDIPFADTEGLPGLNGGVIEVVYADHEGNPDKGLAEAERLITEEEADLLFGALFSSVTATASQVAERLEVPFVVPDSSAPSLKERGFRWFFMIGPTDDLFARNFVLFLNDVNEQKDAGIQTVALIYENSLFGQDTAKYQRQFLEEAGFEIVEEIPYNQGTPDLSSEIARVKAANPDVILQTAGTTDAILSIQGYRQADVLPQGILTSGGGFNTPDFLQTVGADASYLINRNLWALDLATAKPLVEQVNALYREKFGQDMSEMSVRGFVGMQVLADVLDRAGSDDPEAIRQALLETDMPGDDLIVPWEGVQFDAGTQQNVHASGIMTQLIDGQFTTVWPFEYAAAELVWPLPAWSER